MPVTIWPSSGKLSVWQQLGLKDALCGQVAVDLNAAEKCAFFIKDRARGTLQQARKPGVQGRVLRAPRRRRCDPSYASCLRNCRGSAGARA